jgi:hypothetical protein
MHRELAAHRPPHDTELDPTFASDRQRLVSVTQASICTAHVDRGKASTQWLVAHQPMRSRQVPSHGLVCLVCPHLLTGNACSKRTPQHNTTDNATRHRRTPEMRDKMPWCQGRIAPLPVQENKWETGRRGAPLWANRGTQSSAGKNGPQPLPRHASRKGFLPRHSKAQHRTGGQHMSVLCRYESRWFLQQNRSLCC